MKKGGNKMAGYERKATRLNYERACDLWRMYRLGAVGADVAILGITQNQYHRATYPSIDGLPTYIKEYLIRYVGMQGREEYFVIQEWNKIRDEHKKYKGTNKWEELFNPDLD